MPPPGYEPFLAEILARQAEDAPRLVYADWLEENGDARGEFIRLQCQLAQLEPHESTYDSLADRESVLLNQYGEQWRQELPEWARAGCEFRRGFVEQVAIWTREHFPLIPDLRQLTPVQTISLHDVAGDMGSFVATGVLDWLTGVEILDSQAGFFELRDLLSLRDEDADGLADPVHLRRLAIIGLSLLDASAIVLQHRVNLPQLETLELIRCSFTDRGITFLAETDRLPRLSRLDLSENEIGDAGTWSLCQATQRVGLKNLALRDVGMTDDGVQHLTDAVFSANLQVLDLSGNRLRDESAFKLAQGLPHLRRLIAQQCFFTARGLFRLQEVFGNRMQV